MHGNWVMEFVYVVDIRYFSLSVPHRIGVLWGGVLVEDAQVAPPNRHIVWAEGGAPGGPTPLRKTPLASTPNTGDGINLYLTHPQLSDYCTLPFMQSVSCWMVVRATCLYQAKWNWPLFDLLTFALPSLVFIFPLRH